MGVEFVAHDGKRIRLYLRPLPERLLASYRALRGFGLKPREARATAWALQSELEKRFGTHG